MTSDSEVETTSTTTITTHLSFENLKFVNSYPDSDESYVDSNDDNNSDSSIIFQVEEEKLDRPQNLCFELPKINSNTLNTLNNNINSNTLYKTTSINTLTLTPTSRSFSNNNRYFSPFKRTTTGTCLDYERLTH